MSNKSEKTLLVNNFAQIARGSVSFGDLTIFIGPQASGKSIFLQLFKLIIDHRNICDVLKNNAYNWGNDATRLLEFYYGEGTSKYWKKNTKILLNGKDISKKDILPQKGVIYKEEKLFYVPAQRIITMSQGWPKNFDSFEIGDPFVLKNFSESLRILMEKDSFSAQNKTIFPQKRKIKEYLRKLIDENIFYGATIELDKLVKKRFILHTGNSKLPFMEWSAGQKEFMPLLLSLYYLTPVAVKKKKSIDWIIIEEPEMGLHPNAIQSLMVVFLGLLNRGYKVIVSTHSPLLLELAWAINHIKKYKGNHEDLLKLFSLKNSRYARNVFNTVINNKSIFTYYFQKEGKNNFNIKDISSLDAASKDQSIANWGGLTDFASKASEIVSELVSNEK